MNNKYESPEVVVITLNQDVITASLGDDESPRDPMDW